MLWSLCRKPPLFPCRHCPRSAYALNCRDSLEACIAPQCAHVRISINSGTGVAALVVPVVKYPGHGVSLFDAKASHQTDRLTDMVQAWQRWWRQRSRFSTWCTPHASRWRTWRAGNTPFTTSHLLHPGSKLFKHFMP